MLNMKGYKVVVNTYLHTCDDFTDELSGIIHSTREEARKELIAVKNNIEFDNDFTTLHIVEC